MDLFILYKNHLIDFVTNKEKIELLVAYLKAFAIMKTVITKPNKEKALDKKKSKAKRKKEKRA